MAWGLTMYLSSADRTAGTNAISVSNAFTNPLDLGTITIPTSGSTNSTPVAVYAKNTGTTTLSAISVQPTTGTLSGHTDTSATVSVAPDSTGVAGTFGAAGASTVVNAGDVAPAGTFQFWMRDTVASTDSPAATSANYPVFEFIVSVMDKG